MQFAQRLLSTRGGTVAVSVFAAALAAVILLLYLQRYRQSVNESSAPMTVLVAKNLIEKGTPGTVVGSEELFQVSTMPRDELKEGAIADPSLLRGMTAADDIYPGQQLTTADFTAGGADSISNRVIEYERGMAVPLDEAHGLIGKVYAGDHVDVIASFVIDGPDGKQHPVTRLLVQDALVMDAPAETKATGLAAGGGTQTKSIVLRLTDDEAAMVAFAVENGKVQLAARPKSGAEQHVPSVITIERILSGVRPIPTQPQNGEAPWSGGRR
jgi:Flp pilus assembly protein CpaB